MSYKDARPTEAMLDAATAAMIRALQALYAKGGEDQRRIDDFLEKKRQEERQTKAA